MGSSRQVRCPTCGAQVAWAESSAFRPFCSARCRAIDLGDWAAERHRIAGDPLDAPGDAADGPSPTDPASGAGTDASRDRVRGAGRSRG